MMRSVGTIDEDAAELGRQSEKVAAPPVQPQAEPGGMRRWSIWDTSKALVSQGAIASRTRSFLKAVGADTLVDTAASSSSQGPVARQSVGGSSVSSAGPKEPGPEDAPASSAGRPGPPATSAVSTSSGSPPHTPLDGSPFSTMTSDSAGPTIFEPGEPTEPGGAPGPGGLHIRWSLKVIRQSAKGMQLTRQAGACAGCRRDLGASSLLEQITEPPRYCEYTGCYFCNTGSCHRNDMRVIPGRAAGILDCTPRRVSVLAAEFLATHAKMPLIRFRDLGQRAQHDPAVRSMQRMRLQIREIREMLDDCGGAPDELKAIDTFEPAHLVATDDLLTLRDLQHFAHHKENGPLMKKAQEEIAMG